MMADQGCLVGRPFLLGVSPEGLLTSVMLYSVYSRRENASAIKTRTLYTLFVYN